MTRTIDRGHVQCAQLKFHTPGLPNYEGVSIALALFISSGEKASAQNNLGVMYAIGNGMPQYTLASEDDVEILTGISMQGAVSNELKLRMPVAGQT